jgi:tetratricopeptide (TPR) repeat protein
LRALPEYPAALIEVARAHLAQRRLGRAIAYAREAADAIPTQQSVALLADLLERAGRPREADREWATLRVLDRLLRANGVRVDLETAVLQADLGARPLETVAAARRARSERPSIHGDDALAWALARAGRCREALPFARRALRLGTKDPLLYFHLAYAEGCAGNERAMREGYRRALALNPEFSARWAPVARSANSRP